MEGEHSVQRAGGQPAGEQPVPSEAVGHPSSTHNNLEPWPEIQDAPPPPYDSEGLGQLDLSQMGLDTGAKVAEDGRVNIKIKQRNRNLTNLLVPALRNQLEIQKQDVPPNSPSFIPPGLGADQGGLPPPRLNVVIQIVGSRGDVQPFIALGQVLKREYGHRVRLATHPVFRDFVTQNGLEFFSIGGDPAELMAFMVKNPGLMPGFDAMKNGDVGKRRKAIYEMINGCWRSCIEPGDGTGPEASKNLLDGRNIDSGLSFGDDPMSKPFVADAIIANPPSFAHMHIAEKLGVPLHLMFTMPWSPTQAFPHPLANVQSSDCDASTTNFLTYALIDMMTWQGLGDLINRFREKTLNLDPVSIIWAPGMASRLRVPYTYCWSPALIPKPRDWGSHIDISGFYFLNLASDYSPPADLASFLAAGPPPVYIGFGSIVVDDPNAMTEMIFEAVKAVGCRALVSKGWGGIGADELGIPDGVFMLGNCPHDWLFKQVSCVVHHGGAGTSAAGISTGRPTVVVPFFGDQPFWGAMIARAGAGPPPVPYKDLTANKLAAAIQQALKPESLDRAAELSNNIKQEKGSEDGARSFHRHLQTDSLRCDLWPRLPAVWRVRRTKIQLSALAATVLGNQGLLEFSDLKLFRAREYEVDEGPWEPLTGGAAALIGTIGTMMMGAADFPVELLKALRVTQSERTDSPTSGGDTSAIPASASETSNSFVHAQSSAATTTASNTRASHDASRETSSLDVPSGDTSYTSLHSQALSPSVTADSQKKSGSTTPMKKSSDGTNPVSLETMVDGGKGVSRIVSAGIKSPMDFTMALAKGFRNAPKLYGDDTVRKPERITGIQSGLKVMGKEFHYGLYDGITGLVTQPYKGAEKEGAAGFFKGAAKGIGGLILKPAAGAYGIPGYACKGFYAELQKHFGSSVNNFIIAARTAQGYQELSESTPEQRSTIIDRWKSRQDEVQRTKSRPATQQSEDHTEERPTSGNWWSTFKRTRQIPYDERKRLAEEKARRKKGTNMAASGDPSSPVATASICKHCPLRHPGGFECPFKQSAGSVVDARDDEFEQAIKRSVTETSKGNPEEDAMVERALRASVTELKNARAATRQAESIDDRAVAGDAPNDEQDDAELSEALKRSLSDYSANTTQHYQNQEREDQKTSNTTTSHTAHTAQTDPNDDDDAAADGVHDEQLTLALAESAKEWQRSKQDSSESDSTARHRTEEEIVLGYVKRQSLLEDQHRKQMEGKRKGGDEGGEGM